MRTEILAVMSRISMIYLVCPCTSFQNPRSSCFSPLYRLLKSVSIFQALSPGRERQIAERDSRIDLPVSARITGIGAIWHIALNWQAIQKVPSIYRPLSILFDP